MLSVKNQAHLSVADAASVRSPILNSALIVTTMVTLLIVCSASRALCAAARPGDDDSPVPEGPAGDSTKSLENPARSAVDDELLEATEPEGQRHSADGIDRLERAI